MPIRQGLEPRIFDDEKPEPQSCGFSWVFYCWHFPFLEPRFLWVPTPFEDDVLNAVGIKKKKNGETGYHQPIKTVGNLPAHFTNSKKKSWETLYAKVQPFQQVNISR